MRKSCFPLPESVNFSGVFVLTEMFRVCRILMYQKSRFRCCGVGFFYEPGMILDRLRQGKGILLKFAIFLLILC